METAFLCYVQPLNDWICTAYEYILRPLLSVTPIRILSVNKRLRNLGQIQFIAKSSSFSEKSIGATSNRPFGEVGGKLPLQLSIIANFAKIED